MNNNCSPNFTNNMPRIAIINGWDGNDYDINPSYVEAVLNAGGWPVFIAYDKVKEQMEAANVAGVLLVGGSFNFPQKHCKPEHADCTKEMDKRPKAYWDMIDFARKHKLPALGICAGHQMLAIAHGAKLVIGINDGVPLEKSHRRTDIEFAHKAIIEPDSLLGQIIQEPVIVVNTRHNDAVREDELGDCIITARAEDGVIEALEFKNPWHKFVIGVQWHPERLMKLEDEPSKKLLIKFIEECLNVG